jgi:acyl-CoA synthetase (AMP-forming)/AMP-acid ligase II
LELGFSGKGFGHLLLLLGFVTLIVIFATFAIAKTRGVDTTTHRFILMVAVPCLVLFGLIPLWFTDISIGGKVLGTVLALGVAIFNYFGTERLQKKMAKPFEKKSTKKEVE